MTSILQYKNHDRFLLAVDCIIFGFDGQGLKALFIKRGFEPGKDKWSLMGGFVNKKESVDEAAARVLKQLTGIANIYMQQIGCFGKVKRDTGGRVVSIAYFALINIAHYRELQTKAHNAKWFAIDKIPTLVFDHKKMLILAKECLQQKLASHPIGFELLPVKFTLRQLQNLYEAIYESPIDKRNFTRKMLSFGILQKLKEKEKISSRKGSFYFVFDEKKYKKLDKEGVQFI